jgi:hypothetical protein
MNPIRNGNKILVTLRITVYRHADKKIVGIPNQRGALSGCGQRFNGFNPHRRSNPP